MTVADAAGILGAATACMVAVAAVGAAIAGTYHAAADAPTVAGTSVDDLAPAPSAVAGSLAAAALSAVAGTAIAAGGAVQMTLWTVAHCRRRCFALKHQGPTGSGSFLPFSP